MQCFVDDGTVATAVRNTRKRLEGMAESSGPPTNEIMGTIVATCFEMVSAELAKEIHRSHRHFDMERFERECGNVVFAQD